MPVGWSPTDVFGSEERNIVEEFARYGWDEIQAKEVIGIGIGALLVQLGAFTHIVQYWLARAEANWLENKGASEADIAAAWARAEQHWLDAIGG